MSKKSQKHYKNQMQLSFLACFLVLLADQPYFNFVLVSLMVNLAINNAFLIVLIVPIGLLK